MFYDNKRYFQSGGAKPSFAQWFVQLDITTWVSNETLSNVNFSCKNKETGDDVTNTVLDPVKCTYTGNILKPFIRAGENLMEYRTTIEVETAEGSKESFYIDHDIYDG
jgi:hypothetical protein